LYFSHVIKVNWTRRLCLSSSWNSEWTVVVNWSTDCVYWCEPQITEHQQVSHCNCA